MISRIPVAQKEMSIPLSLSGRLFAGVAALSVPLITIFYNRLRLEHALGLSNFVSQFVPVDRINFQHCQP